MKFEGRSRVIQLRCTIISKDNLQVRIVTEIKFIKKNLVEFDILKNIGVF